MRLGGFKSYLTVLIVVQDEKEGYSVARQKIVSFFNLCLKLMLSSQMDAFVLIVFLPITSIVSTITLATEKYFMFVLLRLF